MLAPAAPPPIALVDSVAGLRRAAAALSPPPAVLEGWASIAALDYEAMALRIAVGIERLRSALEDASAGLAGP